MIHQLRIYEIFEHNKAPFQARFRDPAARIMRKSGFNILGMWETRTGKRTEFVYLLLWEDESALREAWTKFMVDEERKEIKRVTRAQHGDMAGEIADLALIAR